MGATGLVQLIAMLRWRNVAAAGDQPLGWSWARFSACRARSL